MSFIWFVKLTINLPIENKAYTLIEFYTLTWRPFTLMIIGTIIMLILKLNDKKNKNG
jgi:hypothetical protein